MRSHERLYSQYQSSVHERQRQMIAEHSAFLSTTLAHRDQQLPRIPRHQADTDGFDPVLQRPGARAAVKHWWRRALEQDGA